MINKNIFSKIIILVILFLTFIIIKSLFTNKMDINKVLLLQKESKPIYKEIRMVNFLDSIKKNKYLKFGFICPGAVNTIEYLSNQNTPPRILSQIRMLTDFLFFIEIYQIYREFLPKDVYQKIKKIIGNKGCKISNIITKEISENIKKIPSNIRKGIPDNFYHIRHDTLICSKDKKLVKKRIELLRSMENFTNLCLGKRDGVSGCRNCCSSNYPLQYNSCVDKCMNY